MVFVRLAAGISVVVAGTLAGVARGGAPASAEAIEFFEREIRPVLVEKCYSCHSAEADTPMGNLRLDWAGAIRRGGDSGPAVVPGKPEESLLVSALKYESYEMPPDEKLSPEIVERFSKWVAMGAPDPRTAEPTDEKPEAAAPTAEGHWAFQPVTAGDVPQVSDGAWCRTDLDRFVLARIEAAGLTPSPTADPRTLLRRLSYDLVGLPHSAEELEEFAAASDDAPYEAAVDRLLASSRFGERWGRYWLDISRYADTKGYVFEEDRAYPAAPTYRDWVIKAFNDDMAYDRFVVAQLAADQLEDPANHPAMGFLTLGRRFLNNKNDIIDDRIDVVTRGLMGITVSCARCHDHKYDPIPTADYYSLYGVFASSEEPGGEKPLMLVDADKPTEPVVFIRGNPSNRGPQVKRHFLSCLSEGEPEPFQHGSGRKELAEAIASPENPLTARVWVNRVWGHLMGSPLVSTTSDFGTRSDPPSHPALLDWLAYRFMNEGWSTKQLIRQIVLSSTYRQSSAERPECSAVDPENRLVWRANRERLDLEAMRDSLLVAAGRLDTTMGGASVDLLSQPFTTRRSVYGYIERQNLPNFFRTFDFASPDTHTPQRPYTTVPQQALYLMNSPFVIEQATHAAKNALGEAPDTAHQKVIALFRAILARQPTDQELLESMDFVGAEQHAAGEGNENQLDRWEQLAQALMMSNEFLFVD